MDEAGWLSSTDPQAMLAFLQASGHLTERKARLFAVACCRRIWLLLTQDWWREEVELLEGYMDSRAAGEGLLVAEEPIPSLLNEGWAGMAVGFLGYSGEIELAGVVYDAPHQPVADFAANARAQAVGGNATGSTLWNATRAEECAAQADLLRDLIGPLPFRPLPPLDPAVLAWQEATVVGLAQATYEERKLPSGHLDSLRLRVLADAMEEGGADAELVGHLRGPGPHVRGCWLVDLLTGRE